MTIKKCDKCLTETESFYYLTIRRKDSIAVNGVDVSANDLCEKCARKLLAEADKSDPQQG